MADTRYQVVGPLAVVEFSTDPPIRRYLYFGSSFSSDEVSEEEIKRQLDIGLVAKVAAEGGVLQLIGEPVERPEHTETPVSPFATDPTHPASPAGLFTAPDAGGDDTADEDTGEQAARPERPTLVAPVDAWREYAVARGMPRDQAASKSKRELIDAFPPE
jgi:hypothetical protein